MKLHFLGFALTIAVTYDVTVVTISFMGVMLYANTTLNAQELK